MDPARRASFQDIASLPVATPQRALSGAAPTVPLGQIARIETGSAPAQIDRSDLEHVATVGQHRARLLRAKGIGALTTELATIPLPDGYTITLGGETEQLQETFGYVLERSRSRSS